MSTNHYKYLYGNYISYIKNMPDNVRLAVMGSAQAYYDYRFTRYRAEGFAGSCINLAGNPQALKNCIQMVIQHKDKFANGCKLIISPPCVLFFLMITHKINC